MKIICIGRNYSDHAKELNNPVPQSPLVFMKPSTALLMDAKPFYHPDFSHDIHYELEVIIKICKNGKAISEKFAGSYYNQIGLGIDFTARDLQENCKKNGHPWEIAKAFDHAAVVGDFIDKSSLDTKNISFQLLKNGNVVQDGNTKDLIFDFEYLISYISKFFTLQTGDLIYTGTPAGVGKISTGEVYTGILEGQKLLECKIK